MCLKGLFGLRIWRFRDYDYQISEIVSCLISLAILRDRRQRKTRSASADRLCISSSKRQTQQAGVCQRGKGRLGVYIGSLEKGRLMQLQGAMREPAISLSWSSLPKVMLSLETALV